MKNTPVNMFCSFCKNAGKSEKEYTSHFLRESKDPNSRVVCPELRSMECRFCFKKGHTVSKCKKLLSRGNDVTQAPIKTMRKTVVLDGPILNKFSLLVDMDDEEDGFNEDDTTVDNMSCMECSTSTYASDKNTVTYADILLKPYVPIPAPPMNYDMVSVASSEITPVSYEEDEEKPVKTTFIGRYKYYKNWADCTSSDEEDDF